MKAFQFLDDRGFGKYDEPHNLMLVLVAELGELCKIFWWKEDENKATLISNEEWNNATKEIANILIYAMKLTYKLLNPCNECPQKMKPL